MIINPYFFTSAPTGLTLDLITPQPAFAVSSARKLKTSYGGSAYRVRRSNDSNEQDVGFSANLVDTSGATTFTGANNGFCVTWYDQSGAGLNVTQATASKQPKTITTGSTESGQNSKPVFIFDGADDYFMSSSNINLTSGYTMFLVYTVSENRNYNGVLMVNDSDTFSDTVTDLEVYWQSSGSNSGNIVQDSNRGAGASFTYTISNNALPAINSYGLQTFFTKTSDNTLRQYLNGVEYTRSSAIGSTPKPLNQNKLIVGSTPDFLSTGIHELSGKMHEIIIYGSQLSTANMNTIGSNIATYYNFTWNNIT